MLKHILLALIAAQTLIPGPARATDFHSRCEGWLYSIQERIKLNALIIKRAVAQRPASDNDILSLEKRAFRFAFAEKDETLRGRILAGQAEKWFPYYREWLQGHGFSPMPSARAEAEAGAFGLSVSPERAFQDSPYLRRNLPAGVIVKMEPLVLAKSLTASEYDPEFHYLLLAASFPWRPNQYWAVSAVAHEFARANLRNRRLATGERRFQFRIEIEEPWRRELYPQLGEYSTPFRSEEIVAFLANALLDYDCQRLTGRGFAEIMEVHLRSAFSLMRGYLDYVYPALNSRWEELEIQAGSSGRLAFQSISAAIGGVEIEAGEYGRNPRLFVANLRRDLSEEHLQLRKLQRLIRHGDLERVRDWLKNVGLPVEESRPTREECEAFHQ